MPCLSRPGHPLGLSQRLFQNAPLQLDSIADTSPSRLRLPDSFAEAEEAWQEFFAGRHLVGCICGSRKQ